uniref:Uncharacterized protein n=1 Tax=Aegilops tauschii subsp. strangulata TaxID=200361 RepID=A0A453BC67_AEGTS
MWPRSSLSNVIRQGKTTQVSTLCTLLSFLELYQIVNALLLINTCQVHELCLPLFNGKMSVIDIILFVKMVSEWTIFLLSRTSKLCSPDGDTKSSDEH